MCLSAFIALAVTHYLDLCDLDAPDDYSLDLCNLSIHSLRWVDRTTIYWICSIWITICVFLCPLLILLYIVRHVAILDDAIGLKREVRDIAYTLPIIFVLAFSVWQAAPRVIPLVIDKDFDFIDFLPIVFIWGMLNRLLLLYINHKQTHWIIGKFGFLYRNRSIDSYGNTRTISLSSTRMRNVVHDSTLRRMNDDNESISLDAVSYERKERLNMKRTLKCEAAFGGFMRHLVKVFVDCSVCYQSPLHSPIVSDDFFDFGK